MDLEKRVNAFVQLGIKLQKLEEDQLDEFQFRTRSVNKWFDETSVNNALNGIIYLLEKERLENFVQQYQFTELPKKVGIVMAGNIPAVGFHDYLCVLLAGYELHAKLSSQDNYLLRAIHQLLVEIEPAFGEKVNFTEKIVITDIDAMIATGSDNSARYFEQYFSKVPNIIRKNRTSCAIMTGEESEEEMYNLGRDIFEYYGLGCRNVSKLFVPKDYDFVPFLDQMMKYEKVAFHPTYENNYSYNKSVYLVNKEKHLDTGFLLLRASKELVSPIAVLYYEEYEKIEEVKHILNTLSEKIQCIVCKDDIVEGSQVFGQAQYPKIDDFADDVDTIQFLLSL